MNILETNAATLNEIIFEKRNKNYGAYVIRNAYGNTILKSLGFTFLFFMGLSLLAVYFNKSEEREKVIDHGTNLPPDSVYTIETIISPPAAAKTPVPSPPVASTSAAKPVSTSIVDETIESTKPQPVESIGAIGTANNPTANVPEAEPGGSGNNPEGTSLGGSTVAVPPTVSDPDALPYLENLIPFLSEHLIYPEMAKQYNVSGKVYINFLISETGEILNASLLKGIGYGCDEEALRVIKLMPKWKPGIKKGKPVRVSFNQVFVFKLQ